MRIVYTRDMRNTLVIGLLCVVAVIIGVWLYTTAKAPPVVLRDTAGTKDTEHAVGGAGPVSFSVLDQGTAAQAFAVRKNYAIYDAGEFATFWKKVHGENAKVPYIDFSKQYVLAVFAGTEPSGGYSIGVSKVVKSGTQLAVTVTIEKPGISCVVTQALTTPYEFVAVDSSAAMKLTHTEETTTKDCK